MSEGFAQGRGPSQPSGECWDGRFAPKMDLALDGHEKFLFNRKNIVLVLDIPWGGGGWIRGRGRFLQQVCGLVDDRSRAFFCLYV